MRSLISIDFPAPEMEPESAHVVSAVSVPSSPFLGRWRSDADSYCPRPTAQLLNVLLAFVWGC